jgi:hypothetical protein
MRCTVVADAAAAIRLPAVCEKCYFPLAEVRKKRNMFSHTLLGPDRDWMLSGGPG